jgi:hypothetical protein
MERQVYTRPEADRRSIEYYQKREALKALSQQLKPLRTVMETHLNDLLLGHYAHELGKHPDDFKTFMAWQMAGYRVKKGEKGYAVWARPKTFKMGEAYQKTHNINKKTTLKEVLGQDEYSFYGMTYLFHEEQVEKIEERGGQNEKYHDTKHDPTEEG